MEDRTLGYDYDEIVVTKEKPLFLMAPCEVSVGKLIIKSGGHIYCCGKDVVYLKVGTLVKE